MITRRCLDCETLVMFPGLGDATCPAAVCGCM
jgi:hypothetical protein